MKMIARPYSSSPNLYAVCTPLMNRPQSRIAMRIHDLSTPRMRFASVGCNESVSRNKPHGRPIAWRTKLSTTRCMSIVGVAP